MSAPTTRSRERVGFVLQLRADRIDDYLAAHHTVWPEMLAALREAGWRNYSLFIREDDGLVFGYLETDDFEQAASRISGSQANASWQQHMSEYFTPEGAGLVRLPEYFHLD